MIMMNGMIAISSDDSETRFNILENEGGLLSQADAGKGKNYVAKMIINNLLSLICNNKKFLR